MDRDITFKVILRETHYRSSREPSNDYSTRCDTHRNDQGHAAFYSSGEGEEHEEDEKDEGEKEDTGLKIASLGAK
ncbi:hypothetical protein V1478_015046 [Vespula squamosa]|uniref:Uncharacterized protein n=1 Tax=Vespula squamosa TaxID=30214 RepID=A0ABD2A400_VESSQ